MLPHIILHTSNKINNHTFLFAAVLKKRDVSFFFDLLDCPGIESVILQRNPVHRSMIVKWVQSRGVELGSSWLVGQDIVSY